MLFFFTQFYTVSGHLDSMYQHNGKKTGLQGPVREQIAAAL
jgi:hypothetical protein